MLRPQVLDGGKHGAVEIDEDHAALVRDKSTGLLRLVADTKSLFFPGVDEQVEEVPGRALADSASMLKKGSYRGSRQKALRAFL